MNYRIALIVIIVLTFRIDLSGQDRILELERRLVAYSMEIPELENKVDISVKGVSIQDLLRGVANNVSLNLTVDPSIKAEVVNNFNQVRVIDVLIFVCKEYELTITRTGNILSVIPFIEEVKEEPKTYIKPYKVEYNQEQDNLFIDASDDTLLSVIKEIINITGKNIVLAPGLNNLKVTAYLKNTSFEQGMLNFCYSNKLNFSGTADSFYLIEQVSSDIVGQNDIKNKKSGQSNFLINKEDAHTEEKISRDSISIFAENVSISELLSNVSNQAGIDYLLLSEIQGLTSLNVSNLSYDEFLKYLLQGTVYTFKKHKDIYLIGDRKLGDLNCVKQVQLQYRTVTNIKELIPAELAQNVNVFEFIEQNSLLLSGSMVDIENVVSFIRDIDKIVPVILIEVMLIDYSKKYAIQSGISAGMGTDVNQAKSSGSFLPGVDVTVGTETLNNILNSFNGWGWLNLGNVTPNFYMSIEALEENNIVKIRSTPKLATLNGHEASLVSGETKYYKEEQNSYYGSQYPQLEKAYTWKAVNADLTVTIKPIVSGNDQVTLDIEVQQSQFTPREFDNSPPGSVTRTFKSLIRVKNNEMVLLGGLDKNTNSSTAKGLPGVARIPVIKWLFSSKTKTDEYAKLSLFIKPTIIY
jgi:type IV pilus assembly protein PilQ